MQLGQYEVIRSLGKGSFGEVFLARTLTSTGFQKTVAIKRLRDAVADDTELIERFAIEARICGHLNHPNIIQVYNFIESADGFLLVMEHLHGLELRQILSKFRKERRILPPAQTVSLIRQLCDGLHFAHVACSDDGKPLGLVHRDIKPSNLMITAQSTLKIMDFGVARADFARTRSGIKSVKGTLQYMAPEQVVGGAIDATVDQYATGLILAEMLIGYPVYHADSENQLFFMVGTGAVEPALEILRVHHPVLHPIVQRALALSPAARFASLDEMSRALSEVERFLPTSMRPDAFCTALFEEKSTVADLGIKPAWPLRQRESNRERERLNALAQNLGMATPEPSEPGSSLTDPGLQLDPISLYEDSSLEPQGHTSSLPGTFPTGVMPAELARLADPLAALREASSVGPAGIALFGEGRGQAAVSVPPPVPEDDPDTELITDPLRSDARSTPAENILVVPRASSDQREAGSPLLPDPSSGSGVSSGVLPEPAAAVQGPSPTRTRAWVWGGISALAVLAFGMGALRMATQSEPGDSRVRLAEQPLKRADSEGKSESSTGVQADQRPSESPSQKPQVPEVNPPATGPVSGEHESGPGNAKGAAAGLVENIQHSAASAPHALPAVKPPASVDRTSAPATEFRAGRMPEPPARAGAGPAGRIASTTLPVEAPTSSRASVVASGAPTQQAAPPTPEVKAEASTKVILRVLPRAASVLDDRTGTKLDCFWGCALQPGLHTLRVEGPEGQGVTLPLEVPAGKSLQCAFQLGLDTRWKCQ